MAEQRPVWPSPLKEREGEEVSCLSTAPPPKKPQLKNKNGLFLMSHVKEMWAALFEYHKQRCRGKRRVQGQALRHRALCPSPGHSGHWVPWHSHLHAPGRLRPRAILHTHGTPFICCSHYSYLSNSMGLNCAGLNWQGFFFPPINMYHGTTPRVIDWGHQYKGQITSSYADFPG